MLNRAMEFHDSTFDGVEREGTDVMLRFSAAYIHQSEGEPGVDAGSGWTQELRLQISDASFSGEMLDPPCDLWDGSVSLDNQRFDNCVPIPLDYRGRIEVNLVQDGKLTVVGSRLRVELLGQPKYVEEFPGQSV
jgi:hypothetical protein